MHASHRTVVAAVVVLAVSQAVPSPVSACGRIYTDEEWSETVAEVGDQIELLWQGTDVERRSIARDPWPRFSAWARPIASADRELLIEQVASMRRWLCAERDDLVSGAVLRHLARFDLAELAPLFLDALESDTADVRRAAVERFVRFPDPRAEGSGLEPLHRDPRFDQGFRVRAAPGEATVRCGLPPLAERLYGISPRVSSGTEIGDVLDVIEPDREQRVYARANGGPYCWFPIDRLERDAGDDTQAVGVGVRQHVAPPVASARVGDELDLPIEMLDDPVVRDLARAGAIDLFDPSTLVVGVRPGGELSDERRDEVRELLKVAGAPPWIVD